MKSVKNRKNQTNFSKVLTIYRESSRLKPMKRGRAIIRHSIKQRSEELRAWCAAGAFYLLLAALGHGCPIRWLTGIPCPGCGLSRAYLALLRGDLAGAFAFHPLFWAVPVLILAVLWRGGRGKRAARFIVFSLGAAFLLVYIWRLASGAPYMEISAEQSLPVRLFGLIRHALFG